MSDDDDVDGELKVRLMKADLRLKEKQAFWETPKGFAAVIAALAVIIGTLGGILGYQIGRSPSPPSQIIFQPGSVVVTPVPAPPPGH